MMFKAIENVTMRGLTPFKYENAECFAFARSSPQALMLVRKIRKSIESCLFYDESLTICILEGWSWDDLSDRNVEEFIDFEKFGYVFFESFCAIHD